MVPPFVVYPFTLAAAILTVVHAVAGRRPATEIVARGLLVLWIGWIVSMTLFPLPIDPAAAPPTGASTESHWNLAPLRTIILQAEHETGRQKVRQLGGNVLVFAPLGALLPLAIPRLSRPRAVLLSGVCFSLGIELAQLTVSLALGYSYRVSDVDDVILNTAGVLVGYAALRLSLEAFARRAG